jgi:prefoldin beta subunit
MPEMSEETKDSVAQFQLYQQQLQSVMFQKETLKLQSLEIDRALEELNTTKQKSAYKITGMIMVNKPIEDLKKELQENKETVEVRLKNLEKIEEKINNKLKDLQDKLKDVMK